MKITSELLLITKVGVATNSTLDTTSMSTDICTKLDPPHMALKDSLVVDGSSFCSLASVVEIKTCLEVQIILTLV
jgi:hypothetical protein